MKKRLHTLQLSPSPQGRGFFGALLLLGLSGCTPQPPVVIEGRLPGNRYDGEVVYLVPVRNATAEKVDSAYIRRGVFRFERAAGRDTDGVCIIRTRPLLRLRLQELLIIPEPGHLHVSLDTVSSAHGTPLNDSLQQWKEKKQQHDALLLYLHERLKTASAAQRDSLLACREQAAGDYAQYNYRFVAQNRDNTAGRFVYGMTKHLFTPEQRQSLRIPD
jgi:hypothetical protein